METKTKFNDPEYDKNNYAKNNDYIYDDTAFVPDNDKTDRPYQPPKRGPRQNNNPKNIIRRKNDNKCIYRFCCKICGWAIKLSKMDEYYKIDLKS